MLNIQQETSSDGTLVLTLEGDATVETVEQLHQALRAGLQQDQVTLDCSLLNKADLYALQLLCSAHRTAMNEKKTLTFLGKVSEPVVEAIKATGLMREFGCSLSSEEASCLWSGLNNSSDA